MGYYDYIKPFTSLILKYFNEKKDFFKNVLKITKTNPPFCEDKILGYYTIYILIIIFIISFIWLIYDIIHNIYIYFKMSIFLTFKNNKRLIDSPLFKQLTNIYYFNDYLSFDYMFLLFISTPIFLLFKMYIFEKIDTTKKVFELSKIFNYAILIIGIIYFIIVYKNISNLGQRINTINNLIYDNINNDFINSEKFCNYLNKKTIYDYDFVYGKCNNLSNNISINKLYDYIRKLILEIGQNIAPIQNITIDNFKLLKDKNGILYKDKIISAFFTYQLIKYYVDNDLEDEAKDFFSAFNLIYLKKNLNILRTKINPILYLRYDDIILFNKILDYNVDMENSFQGNKEIYNYIYKEYNIIQNNVQNIVVDIYNICSYKLFSIYSYYFIIFIIMLILIFYYIYKNI